MHSPSDVPGDHWNAPLDGKDHRTDCAFCGDPAVVVAPRHTGGDIDASAHWVPICAKHIEGWFREVPDDERLPMFPLAGVSLTPDEASSVAARLAYYVDNNDESVDDDERSAYDKLSAPNPGQSSGLRHKVFAGDGHPDDEDSYSDWDTETLVTWFARQMRAEQADDFIRIEVHTFNP